MEVEKNLEGKKKFEKPQMKVVKLKPAYMVSACSNDYCPCIDDLGCGCDEGYD